MTAIPSSEPPPNPTARPTQVPVTVWPCGTDTTVPGAAGDAFTAIAPPGSRDRADLVLAARLIAELTDHHDRVLDLTAPEPGDSTGGVAVPVAAAVLGRRCVTVTDSADAGRRWTAMTRVLTEAQSDRIELYLPTAPLATAGALDTDGPGPADLVVTRLPPGCRPRRWATSTLASAAMRLLAPHGVLAVILPDPLNSRDFADPAPDLIQAAAENNLYYAQHIVALRTPIRDGRLATPPATQRTPAARGLHRRIHTDVLLFT